MCVCFKQIHVLVLTVAEVYKANTVISLLVTCSTEGPKFLHPKIIFFYTIHPNFTKSQWRKTDTWVQASVKASSVSSQNIIEDVVFRGASLGFLLYETDLHL